MKPALFRFLIVAMATASLFCEAAGKTTTRADWRRIYSADGNEVYILKETGRSHLLAYVGFQADGLEELERARPEILRAGYNLLTMNLLSSDREAGRISALQEFASFAEQLAGYEKKVLITPGAALPALLPLGENWTGLVVLRPGDAPLRDKNFLAVLGELPGTMDIAWISSGRGQESLRARRLVDSLGAARPGQFTDTTLPARQDENFYLSLPPGSRLRNFLLLHHLAVLWRGAGDIFGGGCALRADGRRPVKLDGFRVSSGGDRDLCPLYLQKGDATFRAGNVSPEGCVYPLAYRGRSLYCKY